MARRVMATPNKVDNTKLLDALYKQTGTTSDADLAAILKVSQSKIRDWRNARYSPSAKQIDNIHQRTGLDVSEIVAKSFFDPAAPGVAAAPIHPADLCHVPRDLWPRIAPIIQRLSQIGQMDKAMKDRDHLTEVGNLVDVYCEMVRRAARGKRGE